MVRLRRSDTRLVLTGVPVLFWASGVGFVLAGVGTLAWLALSAEGAALPAVARVGCGLLGLWALGGGSLVLRHVPAVRTSVDRARGVGRHRAGGLVGPAPVVTTFRLAEVAAVEVRPRTSDGEAWYTLRLRLADGRVLPLHGQWFASAAAAAALAAPLRAFLGLPDPGGPPP